MTSHHNLKDNLDSYELQNVAFELISESVLDTQFSSRNKTNVHLTFLGQLSIVSYFLQVDNL